MTAPHNFSNTASAATLAGSLSSSATTVVLDSFANFPAPPFTATIARNQSTEEIVQVTDVTGFTVTLTRGYDGTTAQAQSPGASFEHTAVAKHFRDAAAHVATTASAHGTTSAVVGVDDVQTLSNKTVVALLALATAGAPALTANAPAGVTSKLLSLKQAGVEKAFVDYLGNLTAQAVTGTTATFSGALSAGALTAAATTLASLGVTGNATVGGTLGVTGATTLTGALAANGGLTGTTGTFTGTVAAPTVTASSAPTAAAHLTRKDYADALGTAAATASTIMRRDSSGNTAVNKATASAAASAANDLMRKGEVDAADAALDTRLDTLEALAAPTTSGVIAGTAPPAGTKLIEKTWYLATAASGTGGDNTFTYPGGAFPNGVMSIHAQAITSLPLTWNPWGATLSQTNLRLSSGGSAALNTACPVVITVKGW